MGCFTPKTVGSELKECINEWRMEREDVADALGISVSTLNSIISGRSRLSPENAIRFSVLFGGSAESWLALQTACDVAAVEEKKGDAIRAEVKKARHLLMERIRNRYKDCYY